MTKLQSILIVLGSAVMFQVFAALAQFSADDLIDIKRWALGVLVGVAQALGIAGVAIYTQGGLSTSKPEPPESGAMR